MNRTPFYSKHIEAKAKMVDFGNWEMPLHFPGGILEEHLNTRKGAGLFDVSHMGRFLFKGEDALESLQHALSNNAAALKNGQAQYTMIPDPRGGVLDDAFLYCLGSSEYLLVVNAANREKDWDHFRSLQKKFSGLKLVDDTFKTAMLSLQGSRAEEVLGRVVAMERFPEARRNRLTIAPLRGGLPKGLAGLPMLITRTGYTGEPLGFELFPAVETAPALYDLLVESGAEPIGLGARDSLRLEAALPLYGHELGKDAEGKEIPALAIPVARHAVSFNPVKGNFIGRQSLERQARAYAGYLEGDFSGRRDLPRLVRPFALLGRGIARAGCPVLKEGRPAGWVSSGTMVPAWKFQGSEPRSVPGDERIMRAIGLAYVDASLALEADRKPVPISMEIRGAVVEALLVASNLRSDLPPFARPLLYGPEKE